MSWDHTTVGFERYESFIHALKLIGVSVAEELKSEEYVRGADTSCMCYCGYDIGGLDMERVHKHVQTVTERLTLAPAPVSTEEELRSYLKFDEGLVNDFIKMGFGQTCPCCTQTCGHRQRLRVGRFTVPDGRKMAVEEYLAVDDRDCDGTSVIAIEVYPEGERPDLESQTQVFEA